MQGRTDRQLQQCGQQPAVRDAAIAGFNDWLAAQQTAVREMAAAEQAEARLPAAPALPTTLTLVKFSERPDLPMCRLIHEGVPLTTVRPLHRESYTPEGGTPLLDAVGRTIMWMDRLQPTPERTLVVILTDGEENASREFTPQQIRDLIRELGLRQAPRLVAVQGQEPRDVLFAEVRPQI